jgi:hypothetical protein
MAFEKERVKMAGFQANDEKHMKEEDGWQCGA